jgi:hypothetical protein
MNNENQIISTVDLPATTGVSPLAVMSQTGDHNIQAAHIENLYVVQKSFNPRMAGGIIKRTGATPLSSGENSLSTEFYNLIVIEDTAYGGGGLLIPKNQIFYGGMAENALKRYGRLSAADITEVLTFPTIIASVNRSNKATEDDHWAMFGKIASIEFQPQGVMIDFPEPRFLPQQRLNELATELHLQEAALCNELDAPHWAIKEVNLCAVLQGADVKPIY